MRRETELRNLDAEFSQRTPQDLLAWALNSFHPDIALACSFGAEDVALLDMLCRLHPCPRVFYLDTNFHFPETYEVRDRILARYRIELIRCLPELTVKEQVQRYGPALYRRDPSLCCRLRKIDPLKRMLGQLRAWITGIRREQAPTRADAKLIEWDHRFELVKINPLASWSSQEVWAYIREHRVPYNPLHERSYPSIGCEPCTQPVGAGKSPRSGRWSGFQKIECGLHAE